MNYSLSIIDTRFLVLLVVSAKKLAHVIISSSNDRQHAILKRFRPHKFWLHFFHILV